MKTLKGMDLQTHSFTGLDIIRMMWPGESPKQLGSTMELPGCRNTEAPSLIKLWYGRPWPENRREGKVDDETCRRD
jgi:hypothetical protein